MDITQQYNHLKDFKILPLKLRYFQNMVFFIFNLFKENRNSSLLDSFGKHKSKRVLRNDAFRDPKFFTSLYKFSFVSISIKLLNFFISANLWLSDLNFRTMINGNDGILFSYLRCSKFWT